MDRLKAAYIAAAVILLAGWFFSYRLRHPQASSATSADLQNIPETLDGWTSRDIPISPEILDLLDVNQYIYREYIDETGQSIWLFVGYFTSQKFGTGVHSPRNCLPGSGWEIINRSYKRLPGDTTMTVNKLDIMKGDSRQIMYYWFVTRAGHLNNEFSLKGSMVKNALLGRPTDAAFIRINATVEGLDSENAENRIGNFIRIFEKGLYSALPF